MTHNGINIFLSSSITAAILTLSVHVQNKKVLIFFLLEHFKLVLLRLLSLKIGFSFSCLYIKKFTSGTINAFNHEIINDIKTTRIYKENQMDLLTK